MIPYTPYAEVLKRRGLTERVRKICLHGGFTCPNLDGTKARGGCVYCDNRSFSPAAGSRGVPIAEQLERGMEHARRRSGAGKFISYFQPFSGTYAPAVRLRELYGEALAHPDVVGLSIGTRPDCVNEETADLLEEIAGRTFLTLELGLQSSSDETLRRINRAHTFSDFAAAMDLCRGRGFDLCVHVILGLPGETPAHYRGTAGALNRWTYHSIKIHPLHVVKGTALAGWHARGEYRPLELAEYAEGLADFLERVPVDVGVQRFTGDAPPDMLIAPLWCRDKNAVREAMLEEFRRRGSRQGIFAP